MRPAIGYIRVSTAKQGRSGLGIEAQQEALQRFADAEGYRFAETFTEVESGKHGEDHRPALAEALERARGPFFPDRACFCVLTQLSQLA